MWMTCLARAGKCGGRAACGLREKSVAAPAADSRNNPASPNIPRPVPILPSISRRVRKRLARACWLAFISVHKHQLVGHQENLSELITHGEFAFRGQSLSRHLEKLQCALKLRRLRCARKHSAIKSCHAPCSVRFVSDFSAFQQHPGLLSHKRRIHSEERLLRNAGER